MSVTFCSFWNPKPWNFEGSAWLSNHIGYVRSFSTQEGLHDVIGRSFVGRLWCVHQYFIHTTRYSNVRYVLLILDPKCMVKCMVKCMDLEIYKGIWPAQKLWYSNGQCNHTNASANCILASYMSLFGPFSPHAPLPYVTKTRFNSTSRISLVHVASMWTGASKGDLSSCMPSHAKIRRGGGGGESWILDLKWLLNALLYSWNFSTRACARPDEFLVEVTGNLC